MTTVNRAEAIQRSLLKSGISATYTSLKVQRLCWLKFTAFHFVSGFDSDRPPVLRGATCRMTLANSDQLSETRSL